MEQTIKRGMSLKFTLNSFLSVNRMAIKIGIMAIENLRNRSVVESIPFWVSVRTNIPLDPNIRPARIGKIRYIFLMVSLQIGVGVPADGVVFARIIQRNLQIVNQFHFVVLWVNVVCGLVCFVVVFAVYHFHADVS